MVDLVICYLYLSSYVHVVIFTGHGLSSFISTSVLDNGRMVVLGIDGLLLASRIGII